MDSRCMETKQADGGDVGLPGIWLNYSFTAKQQTQKPAELLTKRAGYSSHRTTTNKRLEGLAKKLRTDKVEKLAM